MRINQNTVLIGANVVLVPYRKEHVPQYHVWMQDEWLREMTASDEQSLEEEYENQDGWHKDDNKCTFIVLDKSRADTPNTGVHGGGMAGDVNLFFHDCENRGSAEINVMIAETDSRRKGLAKEALSIMMYYAVKHLKATQFVAKISDKNSASLNLFRSHFQFREEGHSDFFEETTLLQEVDEEFASKLANWTAGVVQNDNGFTPLL